MNELIFNSQMWSSKSSLKSSLFIILILIGAFNNSVLAIDEVVDDYENEFKIASKYQVVRNSTFNAMELKWGLTNKKRKDELSYYKIGYFYTVNMLNETNQSTISILLNTTIPKKCSITVEFSQDNLTWVNEVNKSGSYKIKSGFQTVDLRDLNFNIIYFRFNLTRDDKKDFTPRIYQLRLIYQDQYEENSSAVARPEGWVLTIMIASIGGALLFFGTRRRRR